jgi:hypothetical protein
VQNVHRSWPERHPSFVTGSEWSGQFVGKSSARAAFLDSWENVIRKNRFTLASLGIGNHALRLGPRNGRRGYCHADDSYPFGDNLD